MICSVLIHIFFVRVASREFCHFWGFPDKLRLHSNQLIIHGNRDRRTKEVAQTLTTCMYTNHKYCS